MSAHYQRFLKVLEKWPVDKLKTGRDLGEQIRKQAKKFTDSTSLSREQSENLSKQLDSLERLSSNVYANKYRRKFNSTATGLAPEQCAQVLSSEFLELLNEKDKKKVEH